MGHCFEAALVLTHVHTTVLLKLGPTINSSLKVTYLYPIMVKKMNTSVKLPVSCTTQQTCCQQQPNKGQSVSSSGYFHYTYVYGGESSLGTRPAWQI